MAKQQENDSSNEPIELKIIDAASDGRVLVTPEKLERIRAILKSENTRLIAKIKKVVEGRLNYEVEYRKDKYDSGFMLTEGGPCCEQCLMSRPKDPLQRRVGCRNPFQLDEVCRCHIPYRKVAVQGKIQAFTDILKSLHSLTKE